MKSEKRGNSAEDVESLAELIYNHGARHSGMNGAMVGECACSSKLMSVRAAGVYRTAVE